MRSATGRLTCRQKLPIWFACLLLLAGCLGTPRFYNEQDAPIRIQNGHKDIRLATTETFGAAFSPIVRNLAAKYGKLRFSRGLPAYLKRNLRPFDILLIRSRPALTRLAIPSHFTHAMIWLGSPDEVSGSGVLEDGLSNSDLEKIRSGATVFESAGDEVRLSKVDQIINTDELVVLRLSDAQSRPPREIYKALLSNLGKPFDYNFDLRNTSRLTCMEVIAEVFPELELPTRYTSGRYAIVPDDIVSRALQPNSGLRVYNYIIPKPRRKFALRDVFQLHAVVRKPSKPPRNRNSFY